jgi:hypothetical protein
MFIPNEYLKRKEVPMFKRSPISSVRSMHVFILGLHKLGIAYIAYIHNVTAYLFRPSYFPGDFFRNMQSNLFANSN